MPDICVLTAGQRPDLLEKCLDSIEPYSKKTKSKVYVFGNGLDKTQSRHPVFVHPAISEVKFVAKNRGFPEGANKAIGMGKDNLVLFVSDDVYFEEGAIEHAVQTMQDASIGMVGFKLLFQPGTNNPAGKVQHVGQACNINGTIFHPFLGWSRDNPKTCISGEVFSMTGATFLIRRSLFRSVGGFNEDYGTGYYEDVELNLSVRSRGYKIWLDAEAVGWHYVGATMEKLGGQNIGANRNLFMQRNSNRLVWDTWARY
jgi:O-antigen biosynthesis protein